MKDEGSFELCYGGAIKECCMGGAGGCDFIYIYNSFSHGTPKLAVNRRTDEQTVV